MKQVGLYICLSLFVLSCGTEEPDTEIAGTSSSDESTPDSTVTLFDSTTYYIQIAAFRDSNNARNLMQVLEQSFLPVRLTSESGLSADVIFRVQVGPYPDKQRTEHAMQTVVSLGFDDAFIKEVRTEVAPDTAITAKVDSKQLTTTGGCFQPEWSPSGREIAFYRSLENQEGLYTIGTGGGPVSKIIETTREMRILPVYRWSPGGEQVVFASERPNRQGEYVENLFVVDKDGRNLRQLLLQRRPEYSFSKIRLSPNGNYIAVQAARHLFRENQADRVLLLPARANTNSLSSGDDEQYIDITRHVDDSRLIGWLSETELLFLATDNGRTARRHEVQVYDPKHGDRLTRLRLPNTSEIYSMELIADGSFVIYACSEQTDEERKQLKTKVSVLHLQSGAENTLIEYESDFLLLPLIGYTRDGKIVLGINNEIILAEVTGKTERFSLPEPAKAVSISPSGQKACVVMGHDLYTFKIVP